MRKIPMIFAAIALVAALGCKNQNQNQQQTANEPSSTPAVSQANGNANLTPEQLGELGAKIKNHPDDAQKILSERGLSQQSFEQQVRKVAEDPAASKRYADAYKKAKA